MLADAIRGAVRPLFVCAATLTAAVLTGCGGFGFPLHEETRVVRVEHVESAPLEVRTRNGHVDVAADPAAKDVVITALLRARSLERLEATQVIAQRGDRGALSVRVEWPDGHALGNEGCAFDIRLPGAKGILIDTSNGRVSVSGLEGAAELRSSNGRITAVRQNGPVTVDTSNGRVELSDVAGDIRARSSNGRIVISSAGGRVDAATSNGAIRVGLLDSSAGPVRADSSNGSVVLELGTSFKGQLTMETSNGSVKVDQMGMPIRVMKLRRSSAVLALGPEGQGGGESVVSTSNGDVEVRSAAGGR